MAIVDMEPADLLPVVSPSNPTDYYHEPSGSLTRVDLYATDWPHPWPRKSFTKQRPDWYCPGGSMSGGDEWANDADDDDDFDGPLIGETDWREEPFE